MADSQRPDLNLNLAAAEHFRAANTIILHKLIIDKGNMDLNRSFSSLFCSGLMAGICISTSLIAEGMLAQHLPMEQNWAALIVALGYAMGFIIVILGEMQLFTETTLIAGLTIAHYREKIFFKKGLRLWAIVISSNFLGTSFVAFLLTHDLLLGPEQLDVIIKLASNIIGLSPWQVFLNAVPAGFLIVIIPWMLPNAGGAGFWVILIVTWLIGIAGFSHSVVGSAEAFVLLFSGKTTLSFTFLGFLIPAILGNLVGGACLFAFMAQGQINKLKRHYKKSK